MAETLYPDDAPAHLADRRLILRSLLGGACLLGARAALVTAGEGRGPAVGEDPRLGVAPAKYFRALDQLRVECTLCPRACRVADLERGYCGVRENRGGRYVTLVHSRPAALHTDPIEKKPLFHYLPGSSALSLGTAGCNMECRFCQNWRMAQFRPEQVESRSLGPGDLVRLAARENSSSIAFTYSEPVVFFEYMLDTAVRARKDGLGSVMISNGYINQEPLLELVKSLSAVKIDLKAFSDRFYREMCSGKLEPVLETLKTLGRSGIWFEIVVLILPTENDSRDELLRMCRWISANLGPDVPVHFTRFQPMYKVRNLPATPVSTLEMAHAVARQCGLHFPYVGNVPGHAAESTFCPGCAKRVIHRVGFRILEKLMDGGTCSGCGRPLPGVWT
jgi:pyruvate formate lyase activating enzyme